MTKIRIPKYTLKEELFNSISHGIGAIFAIVALVLMIIKADTALEVVTVSIYGSFMIILYTISCIYHALSPKLTGKKVLRVIDHCNVYLLVFGTYIPVALLGVGGWLGWLLFGIVLFVTLLGIVLSSINTDKFQVFEVICHLVNGWSIIFGISKLLESMTYYGVLYCILGGIFYTVGAIIYGIGAKKKYMHSVFHVFCLLGTISHFIAIYFYLL